MKKIVLLGSLVVVLLALAGGGFFAYKTFLAPEEVVEAVDAPPEPKAAMGPIYVLDPFLVNLADQGRKGRFLKTSIHLELDSLNVTIELDAIKPKIRDSLLTLLSSKTSGELVTLADKERLRNEIIHRVNAYITAGNVVEAYFIEFVVQ